MTREEAGRRAEVMQHYADGGEVECAVGGGQWRVVQYLQFDQPAEKYRKAQPAPAADSEGKVAVVGEWRQTVDGKCAGEVASIHGWGARATINTRGDSDWPTLSIENTLTIPPRPEPEDGWEIVGCRVPDHGDKHFGFPSWTGICTAGGIGAPSKEDFNGRRWIARKIEPTYRDWKISEVPIGAIVISKNPTNPSRSVILQENGYMVWVGARAACSLRHLREHFTMEDGTPCGIKETK